MKNQLSRSEAKNKIEEFFQKDYFTPKEIKKIKRLARKYNIKLGPFRKKFCKKCSQYLVPGLNCRVRIRNKKLIYYCLKCKNYMRFPYKS
jgi:ribonuclease P protein subunit RPR2